MAIPHALRAVFTGVPHLLLGGESPVRAGLERLAFMRLDARPSLPLLVTSSAFAESGPIPERYTADGEGKAPPIQWERVPEGTQCLVLLVEDPDAPTPRPFVHWLAVLPPDSRGLGLETQGDATTVMKGFTSMLSRDWVGCAPPPGDSAHHYHFQLFALDRALPISRPLGRSELLRHMRGHILGFGELVGTYQRPARH